MEQARLKIVEIEHKREDFRHHNFRTKWNMKGDKGKREFFSMMKQKNSHVGIKQLRKDNGMLMHDPDEMHAIAIDFYQKLQTSEEQSFEARKGKQEIWASVNNMVTEEMRNKLQEPLNITKIIEAVQALPKKSCPREDGLLPEFYINKWELINDYLCATFQEVLEFGLMLND